MSGTPENMDPKIHREHARTAGERIAAVGAVVDLDTPVPSCPEWNVDALLFHTGGFSRFARAALEQGATVAPGARPEVDYSDYSPGDNLRWHRQEHARLMDALDASDPEERGWSWGIDQRKAFWFRRAAQELAVHCWDAENAAGAPLPIDAELAADGVDEMLVEFGRRRTGVRSFEGLARIFARPGTTLHFHAADADALAHPGEWMLSLADDDFTVTHDHGKGDAAARGTASNLLLFLWDRCALDRLDVHGDRSLLERWVTRSAEVRI